MENQVEMRMQTIVPLCIYVYIYISVYVNIYVYTAASCSGCSGICPVHSFPMVANEVQASRSSPTRDGLADCVSIQQHETSPHWKGKYLDLKIRSPGVLIVLLFV